VDTLLAAKNIKLKILSIRYIDGYNYYETKVASVLKVADFEVDEIFVGGDREKSQLNGESYADAFRKGLKKVGRKVTIDHMQLGGKDASICLVGDVSAIFAGCSQTEELVLQFCSFTQGEIKLDASCTYLIKSLTIMFYGDTQEEEYFLTIKSLLEACKNTQLKDTLKDIRVNLVERAKIYEVLEEVGMKKVKVWVI
jgi:hypothetical protein